MFNLFDVLRNEPEFYKQYNCGDSLVSLYDCPLKDRFVDFWTKHNYIMYVLDGKKVWHTANGSYSIQKGDCIFVRKGACIVEQVFNPVFCFIVFFLDDDFICDTLKKKKFVVNEVIKDKHFPVFNIHKSEKIEAFFHSISYYFSSKTEPDPILLELKFRELILTIADDTTNTEAISYFSSLLHEPQSVSLQRTMEDNFRFNLSLEQYASLCNRSLSAFKRDFLKQYETSPGKWLQEKRLTHSMHLLTNLDKTISEAAFESGFENTSHFSRSFKERFGLSPMAAKQKKTA